MSKRTVQIVSTLLLLVGLFGAYNDIRAQSTQTLYCPDEGDELWIQIDLVQVDGQVSNVFEKKYAALTVLVEDAELAALDIGLSMRQHAKRQDCFEIERVAVKSTKHLTEQVKAVQVIYQIKDNRLRMQ